MPLFLPWSPGSQWPPGSPWIPSPPSPCPTPPPSSPAAAASLDPRASLILQLLLAHVSTYAPGPGSASLTQLLMGYDVESSMVGQDDSLLLPQTEYSCLTVIQRALLYQGCR